MRSMQMEQLLKDVPLVEHEQSGGILEDAKHHVCDHVERLETQTDANGNEVEVKTEFNIQDWKIACRHCRDMNSLVTA